MPGPSCARLCNEDLLNFIFAHDTQRANTKRQQEQRTRHNRAGFGHGRIQLRLSKLAPIGVAIQIHDWNIKCSIAIGHQLGQINIAFKRNQDWVDKIEKVLMVFRIIESNSASSVAIFS